MIPRKVSQGWVLKDSLLRRLPLYDGGPSDFTQAGFLSHGRHMQFHVQRVGAPRLEALMWHTHKTIAADEAPRDLSLCSRDTLQILFSSVFRRFHSILVHIWKVCSLPHRRVRDATFNMATIGIYGLGIRSLEHTEMPLLSILSLS